MNMAEQAVATFVDGSNCCQSVLAPFAEKAGLDCETALKMAAGFGGGMCHLGETCGAVTGAVMVLGLHCGWSDPKDKNGRTRLSEKVNDLARQFRARHGALRCFELLGCDLSTPEGQAAAKAKDYRMTQCARYVKDAAAMVEAML